MTDLVNDRFEEFRRQFLADGIADPGRFLADLDGNDRTELSLLIEHFLVELPVRDWDEEEFRRTGAAEFADRVAAELAHEAERLADLRAAAELTRESLVERLGRDLGLPGERESIRFYYHHMERGNLPLEGISERVFAALSAILDVGRDRLRRAAELSRRELGSGEPVFARTVTGTRPSLEIAEVEALSLAIPDEKSEVDRLFTGDGR